MSDLTDRLRCYETIVFDEAADELDRLTAEAARAKQYHAAELADVVAERDALRADQKRKIGALARSRIETSLVDQLLEEGPNTETTAMDMEYWNDQHDQLKGVLQERDALRVELANARAADVHSCHDNCTRSGCVNGRLREELVNMRWQRDAARADWELLRERVRVLEDALQSVRSAMLAAWADGRLTSPPWTPELAEKVDTALRGRAT